MFKVSNKIESYQLINKLELNKLPEIFLEKYDEKKIKDFLLKYPSRYYAVRDREKSGSKLFNLKVKKEDVLNYVKNQKNFTINVSTYKMGTQLLTGEILISKNGDLTLSASKNPDFSARDGALYPDWNLSTTIFDKSLNNIMGLNFVIDYIFEKKLIDVIVEFACFSKPLGTQNNKVAIFELRTDY